MHSDIALAVEDVSLVRGERLVVRDLSFRATAGETVAISGPNGAGKTSLLRAIAGLLEVKAGRIALERGDEHIESGEERGPFVGWVGHHDGVKAQLTPLEHLQFHLSYYRLAGEPDAALAAVGLSAIRDFRAQYLSAGQKRRLALARLMLTPRPVWLLDEPFSSLDAAARELVRQQILEHCNRGGIAIAATHEPLGIACTVLALP